MSPWLSCLEWIVVAATYARRHARVKPRRPESEQWCWRSYGPVVAVLLVASEPRPTEPQTKRPALGADVPRDTGRRPALPPFPRRTGLGPWATFVHAWNGLIHTVVHQRNMRIH